VPPRARWTLTASPSFRSLRRTLTTRHVSGHVIVALIEVVSPANKDRAQNVAELADKVVGAVRAGVHVLVVDLFPPGLHDPEGIPSAIWQRLDEAADAYELPTGEPRALASFVADREPTEYLEHVAVGASLPEMPLFLSPDRYINVPLEATYQEAYRGVPAFWREVLERRNA
jgi:hypothetical protein